MNVTSIPESPEVIAQTAEDLRRLYLKVCRSRGRLRYRDELTQQMIRLTDHPERTLRVATMLAYGVVVPLRSRFNLDDPDAGLHFTKINDEPAQGEIAAGMFLNYLLRSDYANAYEIFNDLVTLSEPAEVRNFLGLILATTAV